MVSAFVRHLVSEVVLAFDVAAAVPFSLLRVYSESGAVRVDRIAYMIKDMKLVFRPHMDLVCDAC